LPTNGSNSSQCFPQHQKKIPAIAKTVLLFIFLVNLNQSKKKIMEATIVKSAYEIERGKPMPSLNHSIIQGNLVFQLKLNYQDRYGILPELNVDVKAPKDKVPDIAIYPVVEFVPGQDKIHVEEAPLSVIEILSPTQTISELIKKSAVYFQKGVKSYWLVIPEVRTIYVFNGLDEYEVFSRKEILKDEQLGIEVDLGEIFK
jgi:Uma2 family endonuclease